MSEYGRESLSGLQLLVNGEIVPLDLSEAFINVEQRRGVYGTESEITIRIRCGAVPPDAMKFLLFDRWGR